MMAVIRYHDHIVITGDEALFHSIENRPCHFVDLSCILTGPGRHATIAKSTTVYCEVV